MSSTMSAVSYLQSKVTGVPNSAPSFPSSSDSTYRPPPVGGGFGSQSNQGGGYGGGGYSGYGGGGGAGNYSNPGYGTGSNYSANQGRRWGHHPPREEPKEEEPEPAAPEPPKPPPMVDLLDMDEVRCSVLMDADALLPWCAVALVILAAGCPASTCCGRLPPRG